jgi:cytochrome c oxidase subunit II
VNDTAWVILGSYFALSVLGVAIALIVFRSTRVGFRVRTASRSTLEKRESYWGVAVIAFLVVTLGGTIIQIPYWSDTDTEGVEQRLTLTGRQFAWTIDPPRVRAGVKTQVTVRSADVNHAAGVYDPDGTFLKQVNALPGVAQTFVITFDRPGRYELRCMEFCGVDHHLMLNQIEVTR